MDLKENFGYAAGTVLNLSIYNIYIVKKVETALVDACWENENFSYVKIRKLGVSIIIK